MFAAVEFARHRDKRDVATVSILWLVDDNNYCYWPTSLGKATSYEDLVKNQPIFQKHWKKYAVTRVLRTSNNYQDIDDYVIDLLQEGTTEDEGQIIEVSKKLVPWEADPKGNASDETNKLSGEMKKSTENANDSSSGSEIIDNSDAESQCENNIDSDQNIIDKGQRRSDTGTPRSAKQAPRNENAIDFDRKKTNKKQRSDTETPRSVRHVSRSENDSDLDQQRANKKLQSDTGTPRSTKYVSHSQNNTDLNQQRTNKSQHISAGTPRFSASKYDDNNSRSSTPAVNRHRLTETEFQEVVLKYMEEGKVREEQNQQLLCEIAQSLKASIRGAEKPDKVPELPITDYHVFEKFDTDLTDPIINKYIKNRLLAIGGVEVRAVSMGMLKCVMSDHLALQFNWQGQNQKKSFQSTNLQVLICDTTKQFFNKKIRATDKEIKSAIQDWLKQASNRIKYRSKKNTETAGASST